MFANYSLIKKMKKCMSKKVKPKCKFYFLSLFFKFKFKEYKNDLEKHLARLKRS